MRPRTDIQVNCLLRIYLSLFLTPIHPKSWEILFWTAIAQINVNPCSCCPHIVLQWLTFLPFLLTTLKTESHSSLLFQCTDSMENHVEPQGLCLSIFTDGESTSPYITHPTSFSLSLHSNMGRMPRTRRNAITWSQALFKNTHLKLWSIMTDQKTVAIERAVLRMNMPCHGAAMSDASEQGGKQEEEQGENICKKKCFMVSIFKEWVRQEEWV